jgi:hypothetical protein
MPGEKLELSNLDTLTKADTESCNNDNELRNSAALFSWKF